MIVKVKFIKEPERLEVFNFINLYFSRKHLQLRKLPVIHRLTSIRSISDFLLTKLHAHYPIKYLVRPFLIRQCPLTCMKKLTGSLTEIPDCRFRKFHNSDCKKKSRFSYFVFRSPPVLWIFKVKYIHRVAWMRQSRK